MSAPSRQKKFRLTNIDTNEVSLVDRAANQTKFLVVKRKSDMALKMALKADGNGGFIEIEDTQKKSDDKTKDKKSEATAKGDDSPKQVDKAAQVQMLAATAEHLLAIAKDVEGGSDLPDGFTDQLGSMAENITKAEGEAPKRVGGMAAAAAALEGVIGELRSTDKANATPPGEPAKTEKSDGESDDLKEENAKLKKRLATLEEPKGSNSQPVEGGVPITKSDDDAPWPMDMGTPNKLAG